MAEIVNLAEAFYKAMNDHDATKMGEQLAENVMYWEATLPGPINGRKAVEEHFRANWGSFPDASVRLVNRIVSGDHVVDEMEWTGTHKGPIEVPGQPAIPATGKSAKSAGVAVVRTKEGKITDLKVYFDQLSVLSQLGLAPAPGSE